jgi:hypothetical protein
MAKANKQEMLEREAFINGLIAEGVPRSSIIAQTARKFRIAESSVIRQYYQILKTLSQRLAEERELIRMELAQQLEEVQRKAIEAGANKVVIEAINSRAKLLGLNEKVEKQVDKAQTVIFREKDMSGPLEVVPDTDKAENE